MVLKNISVNGLPGNIRKFHLDFLLYIYDIYMLLKVCSPDAANA